MTVGRNEPCPCGSGKKFKKCCAAVTFYKTSIRPGLERIMAETARGAKDGTFMHRRLE